MSRKVAVRVTAERQCVALAADPALASTALLPSVCTACAVAGLGPL